MQKAYDELVAITRNLNLIIRICRNGVYNSEGKLLHAPY
jgi:hypothetical protein